MAKAKHVKVIELMGVLIAHKDADTKVITKHWDNLFKYIHKNYEAPTNSKADPNNENWHRSPTDLDMADCRALLKDHDHIEIIKRLYALPPRYHDVILPIAVARYLLRYVNIRFNPNQSTTFNEFVKRYGKIVIGSIS